LVFGTVLAPLELRTVTEGNHAAALGVEPDPGPALEALGVLEKEDVLTILATEMDHGMAGQFSPYRSPEFRRACAERADPGCE
jgi:hypothetical protein